MLEGILIKFLASFLIYFLFFGLIVLWFIDGKIKKEQVLHALFSCFVAWTIAFLIKESFPTLRPYLIDGEKVLTLTIPKDGAFPSMHTALAFAVSITIFLHDRKIGWYFLIGSLVVGLSRVLANVHYPADILGGAFLGTVTAVIVDKIHFLDLVKRLTTQKRRK